SLEMGGKRLRPVMLLLAYNLFSDEIDNALPAAVAIEVFHNFTLLHDDIMDGAKFRRNRPTVHMQFSENNAVLSGDVMAFLSYQYLMECKSERLFDVAGLFTATAVEVCEGQQYDMDFEKRMDVTAGEYLGMIRLKTAVLLACALKAGALLANAADDVANRLYDFGLNLGMAFQLQDDLLDTFGDQQTFGKKIGGDILANKKTFLLIKALETAPEKEQQELKYWLTKKKFNQQEKIDGVTGIFRQNKIKEITEEKINRYFHRSSELLNALPVNETKKNQLKILGSQMLLRNN
ncbi:MAG: polyprenyl synthetase family protein, partial [Prolixibacteraceae bacterium]